ncbi:MAG: hypothetical protein DDG59_01280 [Anaerolineae bacterium]|nr:MAG: hypothetical protein DDG59_01280 [Anaerolineae bacterium]
MNYPELRQSLLEEFYHLLGIKRQSWLKPLIDWLMRKPLDRFVEMALQFDAIVRAEGFSTAARWVLPRFVRGIYVRGLAHIPAEGSLLLTANHPGSIDGLLIPACIPRKDLRILASGLTFLRSLPSLERFLIFVPRQGNGRAWALRQAIRHLQSGGALLIFPSGGVDPDPSFHPEARLYLEKWSESVALLLQRVPQTMVQTVICSHVLLERYLRHPLTRFGSTLRQKFVIAEYIQMAEQLVRRQREKLMPCLSFGEPIPASQILSRDLEGTLKAVIQVTQHLLAEHTSLQRDRFTNLLKGEEPFSMPTSSP